MARTIAQIYDLIISSKETKAELNGLSPTPETSTQLLTDMSSASKMAVWRLWAYITAVAIHLHEIAWDLFEIELEEIAKNAPAGTPRWYQKKVLEFQYNYPLEYIDEVYQYATIDEEAKIITNCAIEERSDGVLVIKAVKGEPKAPLSTQELQALQGYVAKVKFAGTRVAISSYAADLVNFQYVVYYDPIVPADTILQNIELAVGTFFDTLDFNGSLRITYLTDAIQKVNGVIDPVFQSATATDALNQGHTFSVSYLALSGHYALADQLSNLITLTPLLRP